MNKRVKLFTYLGWGTLLLVGAALMTISGSFRAVPIIGGAGHSTSATMFPEPLRVGPCEENWGALIESHIGKTISICINKAGRVVQHLNPGETWAILHPKGSLPPVVRYPHSMSMSGATCRASFNETSKNSNGLSLDGGEEWPATKTPSGEHVCYADQAKSWMRERTDDERSRVQKYLESEPPKPPKTFQRPDPLHWKWFGKLLEL